ncbi:hypothetical protein K7X08_031250 [Anisodus acutangulus]|uniref:Pentatricopeptide repeat-containing protein n=1 Tax=Anisodus acutangulus TaxID=402998 RepID=A0A9Q1ML13_9SOLA|nr:hypothetical protein K7X08_031250 [Anisodus acutangulus]
MFSCGLQRTMQTINEMETVGIKPNVKTYTTHIHGWARASLLEKGLKYFEQMKQSGLKPDKAVYHCLMASLLSASVAEDNIMTGIQNVCEEMVESGLTVDMGTAVHWSKCSRKIERTGGDITEALQKTFPPGWSSHRTLNDNKEGSDNEHSSLYEIESDANDDPNFYRSTVASGEVTVTSGKITISTQTLARIPCKRQREQCKQLTRWKLSGSNLM